MLKVIFVSLFASCMCKNINIENLIMGGGETLPNRYPFAVAVRSRNALFSPRLCGGALISRQSILTSAFCVDDQNDVQVFLGGHNIADSSEPFQVNIPIASNDVKIHPDFVRGQMSNDIAIIKLPAPIGFFNQAISPIAIASNSDESFLDSVATTMGWGSDCFLPTCVELNILRTIDVNVRPNSDCSSLGISQSSQICATNLAGGPCNGDQGSPLVINNNGNYLLIGLVETLGNLCRGPAVYTRITSFSLWIRENM